jgi:hypothetical protein
MTTILLGGMLISNMMTRAQVPMRTPDQPIPNQNFFEMEYFYDSSNKKIIVYFSLVNSASLYTGLRLHTVKVTSQVSAYNFCILWAMGDELKPDPRFLRCEDGGWMISFDAPDFRPGQDIVIYEASPSLGRLINCLGGAKEAAARKLQKRP